MNDVPLDIYGDRKVLFVKAKENLLVFDEYTVESVDMAVKQGGFLIPVTESIELTIKIITKGRFNVISEEDIPKFLKDNKQVIENSPIRKFTFE